eukprot:TRINITY_DN8079_c0_g1::TRINITY_DN8079_c0_g1_i1::g.20207::m.20207 TRINITY_DN8079_c0_g1::TRINITY_DN8079_c0_g1_i1::g.20207  ORF type:complete len:217 (-),score=31.28,sp/Q9Y6G5/COMDA_HUMAN/35.64/4e-33,HCaRG/PF07258.9/1.6e-24,Cation_ATPase_N/PF00690.21/0.11 TRINITY_DN8079_c0_g1_i1:303-908(-)
MAKSGELFSSTTRFKAAVDLCNQVGAKKLPKILSRILEKLLVQEEVAFSPEEEQELESVLGLSLDSLHLLIESSKFIFEQAAYQNAKPDLLANELGNSGLQPNQAGAFRSAWEVYGPNIIANLKKRPFGPTVLQAIDWELHVQVADANASRIRDPAAVMNFKLQDVDSNALKNVAVGLSHQDLTNLFQSCERIQQQLDALS